MDILNMAYLTIVASNSIGNNLFNFLLSNAKPIVWVLIIGSGLFFLAKREVSKLIVWLICSILGIVMVYNTSGLTDMLLKIGNTVLGL